ncbi:hypothetical protein T02_8419 [Trichinella nativa]|uniref:Uncharacterized protein n=1 Tax=Trichinella nativa TaxID=6335 RepID=A0A0V1KQ10_9BILA|nr:hypothetical protein T02_8419 [Trichinella nativa]
MSELCLMMKKEAANVGVWSMVQANCDHRELLSWTSTTLWLPLMESELQTTDSMSSLVNLASAKSRKCLTNDNRECNQLAMAMPLHNNVSYVVIRWITDDG